MKTLLACLALLCLSGCAVCERHTTACAAVTIVAVGSATLILHNHNHIDARSHEVTTQPVICNGSNCL